MIKAKDPIQNENLNNPRLSVSLVDTAIIKESTIIPIIISKTIIFIKNKMHL